MKPSYIDRAALLCYLNDVWFTNTPNDGMSAYMKRVSTAYCDCLEDVMRAISEAPEADVRPVVRAKWEVGGMFDDIGRCSNCHYMFPIDTAMTEFHFCPNCGADMREV